MLIYHGTCLEYANNIKKNGIDLTFSTHIGDFGKGFYTTPFYKQAEKTAIWKYLAKYNPMKTPMFLPVVMSFKFNNNKELTKLNFPNPDIEWLKFIINNRAGEGYLKYSNYQLHNLDNKFDIVSGKVADGDIQAYAKELLAHQKQIRYNENIDEFLFNRKTCQISFHTEKAVSCLSFNDMKKIYQKR